MDDDYEFLRFLKSKLDDSEDKHRRDIVPPLPLAFDRVNEGRAPSSQAPLFSLPFEILGIILGYLPDNSLSSLAFVNSDCRQLARSRQFASILLDYSDASVDLIKKLVEEARARRDNGKNLTLNPSLGACIRRMTIATDFKWLSHRQIVLLETMQELEQAQTDEGLACARRAFFDLYIPSIQVVLCDSLPHLELLDWKDWIWLRTPMFRALACSTVKHLKFSALTIKEGLESIRPLAPAAREWPLRSLHLKLIHRRSIFDSPADISRFCANIFSLCAMTLESIVLKFPEPAKLYAIQWFDLQVPRFPALRHLQLENVGFRDPSVLNALIPVGAHCHLRTLEVDTAMNELYSRFFNNRGCIQSLETFTWTYIDKKDQESVHFLHANPQLSKLALLLGPEPPFLEERVLPLLSQSFTRLSSLHLDWYPNSISESALRLIGTLASLQQIHLSGGDRAGLSLKWLVDHTLLRTPLGTLPWLKRIALSQDTYLPDYNKNLPYYTSWNRTIRPRDAEEEAWADWVNSRDIDEPDNYQGLTREEAAWEAVHRKRMLAEAAAYACSMPRLEWLYFGQIPMQIKRSRDQVTVVPLSTRRDDCNTLLSRMFGGDTFVG